MCIILFYCVKIFITNITKIIIFFFFKMFICIKMSIENIFIICIKITYITRIIHILYYNIIILLYFYIKKLSQKDIIYNKYLVQI